MSTPGQGARVLQGCIQSNHAYAYTLCIRFLLFHPATGPCLGPLARGRASLAVRFLLSPIGQSGAKRGPPLAQGSLLPRVTVMPPAGPRSGVCGRVEEGPSIGAPVGGGGGSCRCAAAAGSEAAQWVCGLLAAAGGGSAAGGAARGPRHAGGRQRGPRRSWVRHLPLAAPAPVPLRWRPVRACAAGPPLHPPPSPLPLLTRWRR